MDRYEFSFEATPELGDQAMRCVLNRRGRYVLPALLVALPLVLLLLAADPVWHAAAALLGGAAVMLLLLFLIGVAYRRRIARDWVRRAGSRTVSVTMDAEGVRFRSALAETMLAWASIHRIMATDAVVLLFFQGWRYVALPSSACPPGAVDLARSRMAGAKR